MFFKWLKDRRRKKCIEKGHPTKSRKVRYWRRPEGWMEYHHYVLMRVTAKVTECKCGEVKEEEDVDKEGFTGVSWPTSDWDELKRKGRLYE